MEDKYTIKQVADKIETALLLDTTISRTKCWMTFLTVEELNSADIEDMAVELVNNIHEHVDTQYPDAKSVEYAELPVWIKEYDSENSSRRIIRENEEIGHEFYYTIQDAGDNVWSFQVCVNAVITLP
jgi:hypothetical protein